MADKALSAALGVAFARALAADFKAHGAAVIAKLREEKPADYVKLAASVAAPKGEGGVKDGLEELSDEELCAVIALARQARRAGGAGPSPARKATVAKPIGQLPAVPEAG